VQYPSVEMIILTPYQICFGLQTKFEIVDLRVKLLTALARIGPGYSPACRPRNRRQIWYGGQWEVGSLSGALAS